MVLITAALILLQGQSFFDDEIIDPILDFLLLLADKYFLGLLLDLDHLLGIFRKLDVTPLLFDLCDILVIYLGDIDKLLSRLGGHVSKLILPDL